MVLVIDKLNKKNPYQQLLRAKDAVLVNNVFSNTKILKGMTTISFEEYLKFHREFLRNFYFEALYLGNISKENVLKTFYSIKNSL